MKLPLQAGSDSNFVVIDNQSNTYFFRLFNIWRTIRATGVLYIIHTRTGTTITRAAETCNNSKPSVNSTEGVLYAEIAALRQVNDNVQFLVLNSSSYTQNSIYIQLRSGANQIGIWAYSNGVNQLAQFYNAD